MRSARPSANADRGAGEAAAILLREVRANPTLRFRIVGLVDDDKNAERRRLGNVPVLGPVCRLPAICRAFQIERLIVSTDQISDGAVERALAGANERPIISRFSVSLNELTPTSPATQSTTSGGAALRHATSPLTLAGS